MLFGFNTNFNGLNKSRREEASTALSVCTPPALLAGASQHDCNELLMAATIAAKHHKIDKLDEVSLNCRGARIKTMYQSGTEKHGL